VDLPAGATVQQLLDELVRSYPALRNELLDESGQLYHYVHIFINGRDAAFLAGGLESAIPDGARIGVFPAVAGG
jgi:MoaD family protein